MRGKKHKGMKDSINILGTEYKIFIRKMQDDTKLSENGWGGYVKVNTKSIIIAELDSLAEYLKTEKNEAENVQKVTIRHEIIHAYLYESGLWGNSNNPEHWASDEEITDWIAIQSPKFLETFAELDIL